MLDRVKPHWRLCAIAAVLSASLLVFHGLTGTPEGNSYKYNLPWFEAFRSAFWAGDVYPRFAPDLWYGMGAFDFYFYAPLPFWFATLFGEASCPGCDTGTVFSLAGAWMIMLSGVTFFIFARRFFDVPWAGFGAMLYAVLPYHYLADWFDRQAIGEVAALIILPLIALAMTKLREDRKGGILFALSVAALALSHLPSTLIMGHLIALIVTYWLVRETSWANRFAIGLRFGAWGLLGIGLSAIYWLPALGLLDTVSPDMLATDYYEATRWLLLDGLPEITPQISHFIKACLILVVSTAVLSVLTLRRTAAPSALIVWIIVPSAFTFYLMTVFSYPVWEFWILNKIQFPWRTLIVAELSVALGAVVIVKHLVEHRTDAAAGPARIFAGITACALIAAYLVQVPRAVATVEGSVARAGTFEPVGTPEYVPPRLLEPALERFRTAVTEELDNEERYVVFFAEMEASAVGARAALETDAPGAALSLHYGDRASLRVDLAEPKQIRLPLPAWPLWRARLRDGRSLPLGSDEAEGLLTVVLPGGVSDVELYLVESQPQRLGSRISALALLILLGAVFYGPARRRICADKPLATSLS